MSVTARVVALERATAADGPLVAFPSTPQEVIDAARCICRPIVFWPIDPPPIEHRATKGN